MAVAHLGASESHTGAVGSISEALFSWSDGAWTSNTQGTVPFLAVAYGNGYWVAVGETGALWYKTSPDGAWTSNAQGTTSFRGVAYANGYWVAVGDSGTLRYKATDPTGAWTSNTQGTTNFAGVAYGNGYWVGTGAAGALKYKATDPTGTWTSNTQGTASIMAVAYANGYWVGSGANGIFWYKATDPTGAWTSDTLGTEDLTGVAYGNGYWVMVGDTAGILYYTTDPTGVWTSNTQGSIGFTGVAYANGNWVAVGLTGTLWYKATDPTGAWTSNTQGSLIFRGVAYGNGYWVGVGDTGTLYYKDASVVPRGVVVFVANLVSAANIVTSVTYGGVTVPAVSGGAAADSAGEPGYCSTYFLGAGVPALGGAVVVNRTNNTDELWAVAITVTALGDTETIGVVLLQGDDTLAEQNIDDGSPGTNSLRYAGGFSGLNTFPSAGANSTILPTFDTGNQTAGAARETTAGQGSRPVGFSSASTDDRAFVHLAVREIVAVARVPFTSQYPQLLAH